MTDTAHVDPALQAKRTACLERLGIVGAERKEIKKVARELSELEVSLMSEARELGIEVAAIAKVLGVSASLVSQRAPLPKDKEAASA